MDGLGDYSRNSGYIDGDVTLTNETVKFNYDRGRAFSVDNMDTEETAGVAFGRLAAEFIRTKGCSRNGRFQICTVCRNDRHFKRYRQVQRFQRVLTLF